MDNRFVQDCRLPQTDIGETLAQRNRRCTSIAFKNTGLPERRSTISTVLPCGIMTSSSNRMRNLSGGSNGSSSASSSCSSSGSSTQLDNQYSDNQITHFSIDTATFANSATTVPAGRGISSSHRKIDRCWSDSMSDSDRLQRSVNSSRYKTELCRPFEESGSCKYGDKCQFAHGFHELRNLSRHPKYKTELCRTFHTVGFCPYGPRCHFVHEDETKPESGSPKPGRAGSVSSSGSSSPSLSPSGSEDGNVFSYQSECSSPPVSSSKADNRQYNALTVNINYSSNSNNNLDLHSIERQFNNVLNIQCNDNGIHSSNNETRAERDIFSEISMFNVEDILDNAPKPSSCGMQSMKLDNFPSFMDTPSYWQSSYRDNIIAQMMRQQPMEPFHYSPTGSDSSSGSSSCGGSTESLTGPAFRDWRCPVAIGGHF